jgi:hypothetical protein
VNASADEHDAALRAALRQRLDEAAAQLDAWLRDGTVPSPLAVPTSIAQIAHRFGLDEGEQAVLLFAAAWTWRGAAEPLARAVAQHWLAAACGRRDGAVLSPSGALRRWRLIEISGNEPQTLQLDERVRGFIEGHNFLEPRLEALVRRVPSTSASADADTLAALRLAWESVPRAASPLARPLLELSGSGAGERLAHAALLCAALGLRLYALAAQDIPHAPAERDALARLWEREAMLLDAALYIDAGDTEGAAARALHGLLGALDALVIVGANSPSPGLGQLSRAVRRVALPAPAAAWQRSRWRAALASCGRPAPWPEALTDAVERAAEQFQLDAAALQCAAQAAAGQVEPDAAARVLWEQARLQSRAAMDGLAQRVDSRAGWDDLVLPPAATAQLQAIVNQMRQRHRVHGEWGFDLQSARGQGVAVLFSGGSGTGKTLAAEVLANALGLDLYRIDLAQLVSKYIGETEKNLARVFAAGEASGAVLLFDEADALFGKRSEVRDSHDRYANIEVSYLLQRLENHRGLSILTTNMRQAIDGAFLRRLRFVVSFPFPDEAARLRIWQGIFPAALPCADLRPAVLARLNASGAQIRNIALGAAFLAAGEGKPVSMAHLRRAAEAEFAKAERPPARAELEGWV